MRSILLYLAAFALALLARILPFLPWPRRIPRPLPRKPLPKFPPVCAVPAVNVPKQQGQITLNGKDGGEFWADEIVVVGVNTLTKNLTLVAERALKINGTINMAPRLQPGDPTIDVTLACRDGDIIIAAGGRIELGASAPGTAAALVPGMAQSNPGSNGGHITIIGLNISHEGLIVGGSGGNGGLADAFGWQSIRWGTRQDSAVAVSGCGGHAGDVLLCAMETITLNPGSRIGAGAGGKGGNAEAAPGDYGDAYARAGDDGTCGDVRFEAQGPGVCLVRIKHGAVVMAGQPVIPDAASAQAEPLHTVINTKGSGGSAVAIGGMGSTGGEVRFDNNCRVDNQSLHVYSGRGGNGGAAKAVGGNGWSTAARGFPGGNATAQGGAGAMAGSKPRFLDAQGQLTFAFTGTDGSGGDAESYGGSGGSADPNNPGGASGVSEAQGGPSGNGNTAFDALMPSVPAATHFGAHASRALSEGADP